MIVSSPLPEDRSTLPPWEWPRSAYIHIPFCSYHCGYCDFAIAVGQEDQIEQYLDALEREIASIQHPVPVETVHIGGGTPTLLGANQLARLFEMLARWLPLQPGGELSIEANPKTLNQDRIDVLSEFGVTRVSLGVQSFQPRALRVLERDHLGEDVLRVIELLRPRIQQISLDLIFGSPGQTPSEWVTDLQTAVDCQPDHLSTYGLTYEKGTPFWKQRQRGELIPLDEETELTLYRLGIDFLESAGFEQYEISNFARKHLDSISRRSRHNQVYWANEAYFGFGMGAARYVLGSRELNTRDLAGYLRKVLTGQSPTFQTERLEPLERARETMALQLRRIEGIDRIRFQIQTGFDLDQILGLNLQSLLQMGLLLDHGTHVCLTRSGKYVADGVIERILRG